MSETKLVISKIISKIYKINNREVIIAEEKERSKEPSTKVDETMKVPICVPQLNMTISSAILL